MRFNRVGRKNKPLFRIVVQERTIAPGGRHIEIVGSWDPHHKKGTFKNDRVAYWISKGTNPSDSVHNLLVSQGIITAKKRSQKVPLPKKEELKDAEKVVAKDTAVV